MNGKVLLAAACLISLAGGYLAGKAGSASGREDGAAPSAQARPGRTRARENRTRGNGDGALLDSILAGRAIGEIPRSELAALIARLSRFDPDMTPLARAKQTYQYQLLLEKLPPADLEGLASAIHSDADPDNDSSLASIVMSLATKDPDRALAWLSGRDVPENLHSIVIGAIAREDPMRAADLLRDGLLDGSVSQSNHFSAAYSIGQAIAKLGADPLLAHLDTLPGNQQSNIVGNVMRSVPEGERIRLLEGLMARMEDGRLTSISLDGLFTTIIASDEKGAKDWLSKLPDGERKNTLRISAAQDLFARGEKETSAEWMCEALAAAPGKEKETLRGIIMGMSYRSPEAIPFFAGLLPEGMAFTAKDLEQSSVSMLFNGTSGLTAMAAAIADPGEKARLIANTLGKISPANSNGQNLNANDFDILSRQIAAMGITGENAALVQNAIEKARNAKPDAGR